MIGVIHSLTEMLVVNVFYFIGNMPEAYYSQGYFYTVFILMRIDGLIYGLTDYDIAYFITGTLSRYFSIPVFTAARKENRRESIQGYAERTTYQTWSLKKKTLIQQWIINPLR